MKIASWRIIILLLTVTFVLLFYASNAPAPGAPCISVTKTCVDAVNSNQTISFSGAVTNCGLYTLSDVTVKDDNGTPGNSSDDFIVLGPVTLLSGASANFSSSYIPGASPTTNTVTAAGFYSSTKYTSTASATCKWLDLGCTLTQGYWKTHSRYGPAPYDNTWASIGEDTLFFLSGMSYYGVLWTEPKGNVYYVLAHQFIAAELSMLNGASMPDAVLGAWNEAKGLFEAYTPGQIAALKNNSSLRARFNSLAIVLDYYNMGATGPGHCNGIERP